MRSNASITLEVLAACFLGSYVSVAGLLNEDARSSVDKRGAHILGIIGAA